MQVEEAALRRTVSKNIAAYRKAHKDTQMDLAAKLNYSDKSISKWERGESLPDIYILTRIADLYGITVSNLIGEVAPPKKDKPHYHLFVLLLSIAAGSLAAGWVTARRIGQKGLVCGAASGLMLFLTALGAAAILQSRLPELSDCGRAAVFITAAMIGGVLGVQKASRRKR